MVVDMERDVVLAAEVLSAYDLDLVDVRLALNRQFMAVLCWSMVYLSVISNLPFSEVLYSHFLHTKSNTLSE